MSNSESPRRHKSPVPIDQCGAALAIGVVPDRWTWLILIEIFYGVTRFADIQNDIGIPKSVLSGRLQQIVANGLVNKKPYRDGSARTRHGYVMTRKGRDLVPVILTLMHWGDKHLKGGKSAVELTDKRNGQSLKMGLIPKGGLPLRRLKYTPVWEDDA